MFLLCSIFFSHIIYSADQEEKKCVVNVTNISDNDILLFPKVLSGKKYKKDAFLVLFGQEVRLRTNKENKHKGTISVYASSDENVCIPMALYIDVIDRLSDKTVHQLLQGKTPAISGELPECYLFQSKVKKGSYLSFDGFQLCHSTDGKSWSKSEILHYKKN